MAVSTHPRALVLLSQVPIEYEAGWAPEPDCTLCVWGGGVLERRLLGRRILDETLYRLS